jgi:hypothetical protein
LDQFLRVHGFNERIERCRAHGDKHTLLLLLLHLLSNIFGVVQLLFFCVLASVEKSAAKAPETTPKQKKKITPCFPPITPLCCVRGARLLPF